MEHPPAPTRMLSYLSTEIIAIRCLRRKMQRAFRQPLSNEEVASYWHLSPYGKYFRTRFLPRSEAA